MEAMKNLKLLNFALFVSIPSQYQLKQNKQNLLKWEQCKANVTNWPHDHSRDIKTNLQGKT